MLKVLLLLCQCSKFFPENSFRARLLLFAFLQVMIYNGQLDIIIAVPLTEAWLQTVQWKGLPDYKNASRMVWKINPSDIEVAGWVRQVGNFYQVSSQKIGMFSKQHSQSECAFNDLNCNHRNACSVLLTLDCLITCRKYASPSLLNPCTAVPR